jgi:hypothetical protein
MRIYFVAAIAQRVEFGEFYHRIVAHLETQEYQVQPGQILDGTITRSSLNTQPPAQRRAYYKQVLAWIRSAHLVVAEASFPSTINVGHEITLSLERHKPTIVLYKQGHSSIFLDGLHSDRLFLVEYTDDNLEEALSAALAKAMAITDSRYHVHLSEKQMVYLDRVAKAKRMPRSVYVRLLLDAHREKNKEYQRDN